MITTTSSVWERDQFTLGHSAFLIKDQNAAPAVDIGDHVARHLLHKIVGAVGYDALGRLAIKVRAIPDLTDITAMQRDSLDIELNELKGLVAVEVGAISNTQAVPTVEIIATKKTPKGRTTIETVGWAGSGDGDIAIAKGNAKEIAGSLAAAREAVAAHDAAQIAVRGIAGEAIWIDAADAQWFDGKSWEAVNVMPHPRTPEPHFPRVEILERKSGARLADLLAEVDGQWLRAAPRLTIQNGKRFLDHRQHVLGVEDGSYPVRGVRLPPALLDALTGLAKGFDGDMGKAIGQLIGAAV